MRRHNDSPKLFVILGTIIGGVWLAVWARKKQQLARQQTINDIRNGIITEEDIVKDVVNDVLAHSHVKVEDTLYEYKHGDNGRWRVSAEDVIKASAAYKRLEHRLRKAKTFKDLKRLCTPTYAQYVLEAERNYKRILKGDVKV
jgi:hypothetical protein